MRKIGLIVFVILSFSIISFFAYQKLHNEAPEQSPALDQSSFSSSQTKNDPTPAAKSDVSNISSKPSKIQTDNSNTATLLENAEKFHNQGDDVGFGKTVIEIASTSTNPLQDYNTLKEYGMRAYVARSLLADRLATDSLEVSEDLFHEVFETFKNVDIKSNAERSAYCGTLSNLKTISVAGEVLAMLETESSSDKRACLYRFFVSNKNYSKEQEKRIIEIAANDSDPNNRDMGREWQSSKKIFNFEEMQEFYSKKMREAGK